MPKLATIHEVAADLGLPVKWLRAQVRSGAVPSLKAGRRTLLCADAVERALLERAQKAPQAKAVTP